MALTPGSKLGPYEIVAPLGAGGMGEVYRARDPRLGRDVAVKVLHAHLSSNPDLRARFDREARAISSLSHPNICTLYDVGHQDGTDFLVMELLDGENLASRLKKGPLPVKQALEYGIQTSEALDKAHRQGITHRDVKPGNIMLTKSGAKLMDFGLAKPPAPPLGLASTALDSPTSPTISRPLTAEGTIVGTYQYMAPEQIEGREADTRSDIFALGAVLYEMFTGKRAFAGKSQLSVLSAILEKEPEPVSVIQPTAPPALQHALHKCLEKDPENRWQSAGDLAGELKWIASGSSAGIPALTSLKRSKTMPWLWLGATAAIVAATFFLARSYFAPAPSFPYRARWNIRAPEKNAFHATGDGGGPAALSPDGQRIAFAATDESGKVHLWVRALDSLKAQPLEGTDDAAYPFWSPDSRSLGFFANKQLRRMDASGGPVLTLCKVEVARGGSWNQDGVILFTPFVNGGIYQVPATGGTPAPVTRIDPPQHDTHRWPQFLPDGKHFLYFAASHQDISHAHDAIYVASLDGKENKLLLRTHSNAAYANGYLLYIRDSTLMAQPLDLRRLQLTGEAQPVAENVETDSPWWHSVFTVSQNGILAFAPVSPNAKNQLLWFDRTGKPLGSVAGPEDYRTVRLSPDGQQLAVEISQPASDLWVFDLKQNTKSQLTFGSFTNTLPAWSPDGKLLAFSSNRQNGTVDIFKKPSASSQSEELLLQSPMDKFVMDWSPDGQYLLYLQSEGLTAEGKNTEGLLALPLNGKAKPLVVLKSPAYDSDGRFSPDGRWFVYSSRLAGPQQVFVIPFPGPGNPKQISPSFGISPLWRHDGKAIFYLDDNNNLMETDVDAKGNDLAIGKTHLLFKTKAESFDFQGYPYDVSRDGQKFLINTRAEENNEEITVIANWLAGFKN
jgi:Tol biopolymer transport system component